jgi:large repetitive protein
LKISTRRFAGIVAVAMVAFGGCQVISGLSELQVGEVGADASAGTGGAAGQGGAAQGGTGGDPSGGSGGEPTGGSGGQTGECPGAPPAPNTCSDIPNTLSPACSSCLIGSCCDQLSVCFGTECWQHLWCLFECQQNAGGQLPQCLDQCSGCGGQAELNEFIACFAQCPGCTDNQGLPVGSPCSSSGECASLFCVDFVCCNGPCDEVCHRCDDQGECTPDELGAFDANCYPDGVCSANGNCACSHCADGSGGPCNPKGDCCDDPISFCN